MLVISTVDNAIKEPVFVEEIMRYVFKITEMVVTIVNRGLNVIVCLC